MPLQVVVHVVIFAFDFAQAVNDLGLPAMGRVVPVTGCAS